MGFVLDFDENSERQVDRLRDMARVLARVEEDLSTIVLVRIVLALVRYLSLRYHGCDYQGTVQPICRRTAQIFWNRGVNTVGNLSIFHC